MKGAIDGNGEGLQVEINVGAKFGFIVGSVCGCCDGKRVGLALGPETGESCGCTDGCLLGGELGVLEGKLVR